VEVGVSGPGVTHPLTVEKLREWLDGTCRGPKEKLAKERFKGMLASTYENRTAADS
jgi:hypothetical protein